MKKTFVLDTNVLLHNPRSPFVFAEHNVVIPLAVIEEIDAQKKRQDEIGRNAREVSRNLDQLRALGTLAEGVPLEGGGSLRIEINHRSLRGLPPELDVLDFSKPDNLILAVALNLAQDQANGKVTLVSKDLNLRVKADVLGVHAEDLANDKVDFRHLYGGVAEIAAPQGSLDAFFRERALPLDADWALHPNQFVILRGREKPSASALARVKDGALRALLAQNERQCFGLVPRNKEQAFAMELLLDPEVKVVTLAGGAGTGKTLLALAAGLEQVVEQGAYRRLLVTRPVIPLDGQDLGFLPGDKNEKLRPWMQPIYDNLQFLLNSGPAVSPGGNRRLPGFDKGPSQDVEEYLSYTGKLELEALTYIRGRSIPRQFIIVDEAQNCTSHAIKTLITRVGEGSKIIFTGDVEQIDHPYLDSASNGLTRLVEQIKGSALSGHVTMLKGERSAVAELGASLS